MKRILTGITPSGYPHLGNYIGAIKPSLELLEEKSESFLFIADLHALIKVSDKETLKELTNGIAMAWLASGLDPEKTHFYRQSDIPEIPEITWILSCIAEKGLLNRAHAYKAAVDLNNEGKKETDEGISMGLYSYPLLMAADILTPNATHVPVGKDQQQHLDSFGAIVDSIQNKGVGLAEIRYQAKEKTHTLLHKAEVIHLQDVANLIEWLNRFLFFSFILWLMILLYQFKKPFDYTTKQAFSAIVIGSVLLSLPIFVFGAEKVFYQFHIWVFPDDHQWFFYYQDSLMATMMKAPDIFAYIALSLVFFTLVIYILISKILKTLQNRLK